MTHTLMPRAHRLLAILWNLSMLGIFLRRSLISSSPFRSLTRAQPPNKVLTHPVVAPVLPTPHSISSLPTFLSFSAVMFHVQSNSLVSLVIVERWYAGTLCFSGNAKNMVGGVVNARVCVFVGPVYQQKNSNIKVQTSNWRMCFLSE